MALMKRIDAVLMLAGKCRRAADIGCDHGRFSVRLIRSGAAGSVSASDIGAAPLDKCRRLRDSLGIPEDRLSVTLSDGLSHLAPGECDVIIIAGMGGEVISGIIERGMAVAACARLILQPMTRPELLREKLYNAGFRETRGIIALEGGRFYQIMELSRSGDMALPAWWPQGFYELAPWVMHDPLARPLIESRLKLLAGKLDRAAAKGARAPLLSARLEAYGSIYERMDTDIEA